MTTPIAPTTVDSHLKKTIASLCHDEIEASAMTALVDAIMYPKSLLRIRVRNTEEFVRVTVLLGESAVHLGYYSHKKPLRKGPDDWPIFELSNGSGIILSMEPKHESAVKQYEDDER